MVFPMRERARRWSSAGEVPMDEGQLPECSQESCKTFPVRERDNIEPAGSATHSVTKLRHGLVLSPIRPIDLK